MPDTEKLLVFNGYGKSNPEGPKLANWVRQIDPDVALISEIGDLVDDLNKAGNVRVSDKDTPHDVGVFFKGRIDGITRKQLTRYARHSDEKPMLWRDRHLIKIRKGDSTYYSVHANAAISGPQGRWLDNKGAELWKNALLQIEEMVENDNEKGRHVRIGGDFNFPKSDANYSPNNLFKKLGLHFMNDGVMWLAWSKRDELIRRDVLGRAPGADAHKSLTVTLRKNQ